MPGAQCAGAGAGGERAHASLRAVVPCLKSLNLPKSCGISSASCSDLDLAGWQKPRGLMTGGRKGCDQLSWQVVPYEWNMSTVVESVESRAFLR